MEATSRVQKKRIGGPLADQKLVDSTLEDLREAMDVGLSTPLTWKEMFAVMAIELLQEDEFNAS